jgi:uncharacterized protein (TIGR02466 family)
MTKNKIKNLYFATQIYHEKIVQSPHQQKKLLKELMQEAHQIQSMDSAGRSWSKINYPNGYTSYSSQDQLHQLSSTFQNLSQLISKHVDHFLKSLDMTATTKNLKMTDCWLNIMNSNTTHAAHIHPHSVISGTVYVSTPPKASGIKFLDPRWPQFMNAPLVSESAQSHNQRFITLSPKAGDVVLFESWLNHEVPLNFSKEPRISVSFNYDWK